MGRPRLAPENAQAWEAWIRLCDQFDLAEYQEKSGDQILIYRRPIRFRQESAWPVIISMEPDDPLSLFDRVSVIASEFILAWRPSGR